MKQLITITVLACVLIFLPAFSQAQGNSNGTFFGKAYFDYEHDFSKDRGPGSGQTNKFNFTRIYFGYDKDVDENFSIRFLMDAENSAGAWRPFMKNAYLSGKCRLVEGARWYVGMVPTALTNVPEAGWGYRSIYKMPMDIMGWGSTADLGIYWKGMFKDMLQVEFNVVNGAGYKNVENDMFKLFDLRPTLYLLENKALAISAYGSFEAVNDSSNAIVASGFVGYEVSIIRLGVEYSMQSLSKTYLKTGATSYSAQSSSALAAWTVVKATDKLNLLARYDIYDDNIDLDKDASAAIIGGVDFHPIKNVHIIPNVQIMTVEADNISTTPIDESASQNTAFITFEYSW